MTAASLSLGHRRSQSLSRSLSWCSLSLLLHLEAQSIERRSRWNDLFPEGALPSRERRRGRGKKSRERRRRSAANQKASSSLSLRPARASPAAGRASSALSESRASVACLDVGVSLESTKPQQRHWLPRFACSLSSTARVSRSPAAAAALDCFFFALTFSFLSSYTPNLPTGRKPASSRA